MLTTLSPSFANCLEILAASTSRNPKGLSRHEMAKPCILHLEENFCKYRIQSNDISLEFSGRRILSVKFNPFKVKDLKVYLILGEVSLYGTMAAVVEITFLPVKEYLNKLYKNKTINPNFPVQLVQSLIF